MSEVIVAGGFDDLNARDLRFLEEAAKLGRVTALIWPDAVFERINGRPPRCALAERRYVLAAVRTVAAVTQWDPQATGLPDGMACDIWAERDADAGEDRERWCRGKGISYRIIPREALAGFPPPAAAPSSGRKKVLVTGCYDWLHSGHVRFFEEASALGDLIVSLGNDANIRALKGEGHPLLGEDERRYVVGSIRTVAQALISTGFGWLDAEPEIRRLRPDYYVVNKDGDQGGKREYCAANGIEYVVLRRVPAPGLPRRSSTDLRGF